MERVNKIVNHPAYIKAYKRNEELEKDREFCCHDMNHFLDVARIAYVMKLERGAEVSKEMIYAAAMLHDIGRAEQYLTGVPHEAASVGIAFPILEETGFERDEIRMILSAVKTHRSEDRSNIGILNRFIYEADKLSRNCRCCASKAQCNWSEDKMNIDIGI